MTDRDVENLASVGLMTRKMREHQEAITQLGRERRVKVLDLRASNITYRLIAEAMGTTQQAVLKVLRTDL